MCWGEKNRSLRGFCLNVKFCVKGEEAFRGDGFFFFVENYIAIGCYGMEKENSVMTTG